MRATSRNHAARLLHGAGNSHRVEAAEAAVDAALGHPPLRIRGGVIGRKRQLLGLRPGLPTCGVCRPSQLSGVRRGWGLRLLSPRSAGSRSQLGSSLAGSPTAAAAPAGSSGRGRIPATSKRLLDRGGSRCSVHLDHPCCREG
eukprot:scaffold7377_cov257-Pinguiococcus_pyrenoidosus.AAC.17